MKILALIYLILLGGVWLYSWGEYPLMKMTTEMAVSAIENNYVREDLTDEEVESLDFYTSWIRANQTGVNRAWSNASSSILYLFLATLVLNLYNLAAILFRFFKNRKAE